MASLLSESPLLSGNPNTAQSRTIMSQKECNTEDVRVEGDVRKEMCVNPPNRMNYTNISNQPAMFHFPSVKRASVMSSTPLYVFKLVKCIVLGLSAVKQSSFVIPLSRAAIPNDNPPSGCLMKTKALLENSLLSGRNYAHVLVSVWKKQGGDAGMIQGSERRSREW